MEESAHKGLRWYAVHVKSNHEKKTAKFLAEREVEHFFPLYRSKSRRKDRAVDLTLPLFTGYIFVRIDLQKNERIQVLKAPGTVRIVGFARGPAPVEDETISSLRILSGEADAVKPHPLVRVGQKVRVQSGPFTGAVGILEQKPGRKPSLVVEVDFLGRAVAVKIDEESVVPVLD